GPPLGAGRPALTGLLRGNTPLVAELLLQRTEAAVQLERLQRRLLVEPLQREADMDDRVLADLQVRQVLQTHFLQHATEVHRPHPGSVVFPDLHHLSWHRETHLDPPCGRPRPAARVRVQRRSAAPGAAGGRRSPPGPASGTLPRATTG